MLAPLFKRVLLQREISEKKGSIYLPKSHQLRHAALKCTVVAIGDDVNDEVATNTRISVGDVVIIGKHAGAWLDHDGNPVDDPDTAEFYIIQDEDILARVVNDE